MSKYHLPQNPFVLGGWGLSGWMWGGGQKSQALKTVHAALANGIDGIDTAPIYGFGRSEEWIGEAIEGHKSRCYLASKCGMVWHTWEGKKAFDSDEWGVSANGSYRVRLWLHPQSLRYELEQSLRRLKREWVDLYQVHWYDEKTPLEDVMETLLRFRQEGKVREIGVCNFSTEKMIRCLKSAPLASDQERFSMIDRKVQRNQIAFCRNRGMGFFAYSPLSHGLLAKERPLEERYSPQDLRSSSPRFSLEQRQGAQQLLSDLAPLRERYGVGCGAFALAWVLNVPGVTHVIGGARSPQQVEENLKAINLRLTPEDKILIDTILQKTQKIFRPLKH